MPIDPNSEVQPHGRVRKTMDAAASAVSDANGLGKYRQFANLSAVGFLFVIMAAMTSFILWTTDRRFGQLEARFEKAQLMFSAELKEQRQHDSEETRRIVNKLEQLDLRLIEVRDAVRSLKVVGSVIRASEAGALGE